MSETAWEQHVTGVASRIVEILAGRRPTLGSTRLVCVDGRAGSGKTTLGRALRSDAERRGSTRLLHMDDMYEGWSGLGEVSARVERDLLDPLASGRPGRYQRYDWEGERFADWHTVHPVDFLVLEGVASGALSVAVRATALVWVEAPRELRLARGVERDGTAVLPRWLTWMEEEDALFEREDTRARADVEVDGSDAARSPMVTGSAD
ncbi:MAG: hypothetical protein M3393_09655 [Actinomycetota bacterium]|nr:hypothetical protein [Actinomycetota bacterium]